MSLPALPRRAAYITLNSPHRRNALSLAELRSLRDQLIKANTSPTTGQTLLLPPFKPSVLSILEQSHASLTRSARDGVNSANANASASANSDTTHADADDPASSHDWLVSARAFARARAGLPSVLVLASRGPVFCSGHDLRELRALPAAGVAETFRLCAEVMALIRRCPALVIARVSGHAVAAGCQLALTADLPIAFGARGGGYGGGGGSSSGGGGVRFRLPGAGLGLPCSSPVTAVSRRLGNARALRMLATADDVPVEELADVVRVVYGNDGGDAGGGGGAGSSGAEADDDKIRALDQEVLRTVERLAGMSSQQNAMGKWAFWTQAGLTGQDYVGADGTAVEGGGGDGYLDAVEWAGRLMALHAKSEDAKEGMDAFLQKREAVWHGMSEADNNA